MSTEVIEHSETNVTPDNRVSSGEIANRTHPAEVADRSQPATTATTAKSAKVDRLLPLGGFGKRHILPCRTALVFRRKLEALVTDDPSVIPPAVALLIDEAVRYELAARVVQKLIRTPALTAAETSGLLGQFLKYTARRDAAVRKILGPGTEKARRERLLAFYTKPYVPHLDIDDGNQGADVGDVADEAPLIDPSDKLGALRALYAMPAPRWPCDDSAAGDASESTATAPQRPVDAFLGAGRPENTFRQRERPRRRRMRWRADPMVKSLSATPGQPAAEVLHDSAGRPRAMVIAYPSGVYGLTAYHPTRGESDPIGMVLLEQVDGAERVTVAILDSETGEFRHALSKDPATGQTIVMDRDGTPCDTIDGPTLRIDSHPFPSLN